jgi:putative endonuclease
MIWWVYMVQGKTGVLYTGVTTDVERRLRQHNGEERGGARATRAHRPYTMVYTKSCASQSEAQVCEYAIKKLTKKEKVLLLQASVTK